MLSAESHPTTGEDVQILNPLETADWDGRLKSCPLATFFHTAAWARVLQSTYGYQPLYFATGNAGNIVSLLPLMEIDSWLTGRRGIALPFTDACDPLGVSASSLAPLFACAQRHAAEKKWRYLEYRGGRFALGDAPAASSFLSHSLKLQADETILFSQCDSSVRQAVRKAKQHKLTVEFSQTRGAVRSFYDLFCLTRQKHGAPPPPFAFFSNIQRHVLACNQGWVALARNGEVPVAGAVFLHYGKSVIYKYGASNGAFQHLRANNLVMWEAIRRFARSGYETLDFGRTDRHNEGLRRFKLSWGAEERKIEYFRYDVRAKQYVAGHENGERIHQRLGRRLPRFLSRLIGLLLYKHIAAFTFSLDWSRFGYIS